MLDKRKMRLQMRRLGVGLWLAVLGSVGLAAPGSAQDVPFFKGRSIDLVIPFYVGGGYDGYARLVARYLPRYIPGAPTIVARNMPGAGGLAAVNFLYQSAAKDGTVIGAPPDNIALGQEMAEKNVSYDARRFRWVGRITTTMNVLYTWHTVPVHAFADLMTRETVEGGTQGHAASLVYPEFLSRFLGARIRLIKGFPGSNELDRALERGEIELVMKPWQALKSGAASGWLRDGSITLLAQFALDRNADLPELPSIMDLMQTDEQRQLMRLFLSPTEIGRSLLLPPDVPSERVAMLRMAFSAMMRDPELQADAARLNLDLDPLGGEALQKLVDDSYDVAPAVLESGRQFYFAE